MQDDAIPDPRKIDRDYDRLLVLNKSNMTYERFIENVIHGVAVVAAAFWFSAESASVGFGECCHVFVPWTLFSASTDLARG